MTKLTDFEREVLRDCAEPTPKLVWGAAVGAAIEFLKKFGYLDHTGKLTERGRQELLDDPEEDEQRRREAQESYDLLVRGPRRDDP